MTRQSSILSLILVLLTALSSCGVPEFEVVDASSLQLPIHEAEMWVGDSILFEYTLEPAVNTSTLYWYTRDAEGQSPVSISGHKVKATRPGDTWVIVQAFPVGYSVTQALLPEAVVDSCRLHVIDWDDPLLPYRYEYDMPVMAQLTIGNAVMPEGYEVGAMVDGELRGYARRRSAHGIDYLELRVYSHEPAGERIDLVAYDRHAHQIIPLHPSLTFRQRAMGTLSDLIKITN